MIANPDVGDPGCPSCDFGLPYGCSCVAEPPRDVLAEAIENSWLADGDPGDECDCGFCVK